MPGMLQDEGDYVFSVLLMEICPYCDGWKRLRASGHSGFNGGLGHTL
jgi:hypothetical protein